MDFVDPIACLKTSTIAGFISHGVHNGLRLLLYRNKAIVQILFTLSWLRCLTISREKVLSLCSSSVQSISGVTTNGADPVNQEAPKPKKGPFTNTLHDKFSFSTGIRVVSNAGGINPHACAKAIHDVAKKSGVEDLKIAVLTGDNLKGKVMNNLISCFNFFLPKNVFSLKFLLFLAYNLFILTS